MNTLEHIDCPICEHNAAEPLFDKDSLSVVICKQCRLRYVNPRINRQTLEAAYTEAYYPPDKVERIRTDSMEWLQMNERLIELEKQHPSKGRLLDVGCGIGTFLYLSREHGWEAHGIDPSKSGSAFAQKKYELDVQCSDIFEANFPSAHFDAIVLYHVLEHISELNPFLSELRRVLKPETGTLVIEVPNGEGLQSRLQKADWPYVHPHDHLYYFSAHSLPQLLQKHGFQSVTLGKPKRVTPTTSLRFALRQAVTSLLVQFHLGTVIRVYAS
ncbi:class I SAM-dependent methyltransferase [Candidatus Poribacteria bacterium]|nr:class I SAM-dependent methyltransferase [Candidatus Poribacteria bacterium]